MSNTEKEKKVSSCTSMYTPVLFSLFLIIHLTYRNFYHALGWGRVGFFVDFCLAYDKSKGNEYY